MRNLPNEYNRENYMQLANLSNIKVKQEFKLIIVFINNIKFKLIMLDIKILNVNIFINESIKITAHLIKTNTSAVIKKCPANKCYFESKLFSVSWITLQMQERDISGINYFQVNIQDLLKNCGSQIYKMQ
jgi:hypothetical protein